MMRVTAYPRPRMATKEPAGRVLATAAKVARTCAIEPLDRVNLDDVVRLAKQVFGDEGAEDEIAALVEETPKAVSVRRQEGLLDASRQWIARDRQDRQVVGTVGLYHYADDDRDVAWLAWLAVANEKRGQGIGRELVQHVIREASALGKRYLRLFTSDADVNAQTIYERMGFRITEYAPSEPQGVKCYFRELEL